MPAYFPPASIVIDLSIVTGPKPPDSFTTISPPALVFARAPAKVLQGLALVQALLSSPDGATQVRFDCARAGEMLSRQMAAAAVTDNVAAMVRVFIIHPHFHLLVHT